MELIKSKITTIFLLFLLVASLCISRGKSEAQDSEIYDIDYRGPETHSSVIPPPGHSHGRPLLNRKTTKTSPKSKGLNSGNSNKQAEKIHG